MPTVQQVANARARMEADPWGKVRVHGFPVDLPPGGITYLDEATIMDEESVRRMMKEPGVIRHEKEMDRLTGGKKFDDGKPRMDLLPPDALLAIGGVLTYGAQKYGARNWEGGLAWGRLAAAAQRHLLAWQSGEEADPETGLLHLSHAACCLLMLLASTKRGIGADDRKLD